MLVVSECCNSIVWWFIKVCGEGRLDLHVGAQCQIMGNVALLAKEEQNRTFVFLLQEWYYYWYMLSVYAYNLTAKLVVNRKKYKSQMCLKTWQSQHTQKRLNFFFNKKKNVDVIRLWLQRRVIVKCVNYYLTVSPLWPVKYLYNFVYTKNALPVLSLVSARGPRDILRAPRAVLCSLS